MKKISIYIFVALSVFLFSTVVYCQDLGNVTQAESSSGNVTQTEIPPANVTQTESSPGNVTQAQGSKVVLDTGTIRYDNTPLNKLSRGLGNTLTCYFELPASIFRTGVERGPFLAWIIGPVNGLFTTLVRFGTGVFDTATFLIPPYGKPLMNPEYASDSLYNAYKAAEAKDAETDILR